jgi:hypothetical protein
MKELQNKKNKSASKNDEEYHEDNYEHVLTFKDGKLISDKFIKIEELKCGDCDCKIKYENIGCDTLKDCKKEW